MQSVLISSSLPFTHLQGLVFYAHNSPATNAAIAALLQRIAVDLELEPMLYQVCFCALT